ncbi:MAG TPA: aminopeptidase [Baekduia sp.]|uniref:aminopeptidase n=1 Tax=Baekduia sp. TaxID=2600305 RepID=UPI002BA5FEAE|nr:aminopeptidase [Baekduia sp.]HMJ34675.1 aminopeptidase [Baekduia sp.]
MSSEARAAFDDPELLGRFAELVIGFAANVHKGQVVAIGSEIGKEEVTRALAAAAYRHGAKFVDVSYFDLHVKRARLLHADDDTLDFVPPWYGERILELGRLRAARVGLTGPAQPGLLSDLDPSRIGRDQLPAVRETGVVVNDRTTNWTAVPCPTRPWAELVHPDLDPEEAWVRLCEQIVHVCRLDEADPIAAWRERAETLVGAAEKVTARRFDALRYVGPGTDLTLGLLPSSKFLAARFETVDGIVHLPNLPSEEIFTSPDPARADGVVRATKPLVLGGSIIRGLEVEFRDGRAVRIDADENAEVLRSYAARDDGAARLGEAALVDGDGRIGALDTVFFDTLLDENAASHIALGHAYTMCADEADAPKLNESTIHVDFMIGSREVSVHGIAADGTETPVLVGGAWQL